MSFAVLTRARWLVLALGTAVSACSTLQTADFGEAAPPEFELQGRIAVRHGTDGGSARIEWRHAKRSDDLLVTNALGQGIARITRRGDDVRLLTADNTEHRAQDAESLTEAVLGWRLPLGGLPFWVRGAAAEGREARIVHDDQGRVRRIEQDDWRIDYLDWKDERPARMTLQHGSDAGNPAIEIRLVVDSWQTT